MEILLYFVCTLITIGGGGLAYVYGMYGDEVMKEENLGKENGLLYLQNLVKKLHIV